MQLPAFYFSLITLLFFANTVNVQFLANALLEEATSMQKIMHNCIIRFLPV